MKQLKTDQQMILFQAPRLEPNVRPAQNNFDCNICDDSGWDFKDRGPPFPPCCECKPQSRQINREE